jgi:NIMA (never in mitosis gene a)-related kinase
VRELFVDQQYVVKEIDTSKMPKEIALEQLMEIELLGELDSQFIVGYFDSFIEDTKINIIMEYCQNGDLQSYLKRQNGKPLVENFIWKVFIQICLGIHYLHSRGVLHRDLKTLNIFLGKDKEAKIGDLGAALKVKTETETEVI